MPLCLFHQSAPRGPVIVRETSRTIGRSSDLQARANVAPSYSLLLPSLKQASASTQFSFLLTAAGQPWILTRFPFHPHGGGNQ
jgi:hypothetical protein